MRTPRHPPPCAACGHVFEPDEPVMVVFNYWRSGRASHVWVPICVDCWDCTCSLDSPEERPLRRCLVCRQPMLASWSVVTCSNGCAQHKRRQRRKGRRRGQEDASRCAMCRTSFVPTRSDAQFCSNACRQWAYRQRQRASAGFCHPWVTNSAREGPGVAFPAVT
jgi:hypothetical protein